MLTRRTEMLMLVGSSRQEMATALELPVETVDDYIRRVKDRWRDNPLPGRDEARELAIRRYLRELTNAIVNKAPARDKAIWEDFLLRVQGTEAPKQVIASTPPGQPIEVTVNDPRRMTHGARLRRIAELEAEEAAETGAAGAGAAADKVVEEAARAAVAGTETT